MSNNYLTPPLAQLVEQLPFKEKVPRSIRGGRINKELINKLFFCWNISDKL